METSSTSNMDSIWAPEHEMLMDSMELESEADLSKNWGKIKRISWDIPQNSK